MAGGRRYMDYVNYMDVDPNASIAECLRVPLPRHMQDIGCAAVEFPTD